MTDREEKLTNIKTVSLFGSRNQEGHVSGIIDLISRFISKGIRVNVEKKLAETLQHSGFRAAVHGVRIVSRFPQDSDLAISVGGDGTFLRTAKWIAGNEVPVIGINTGHLGFLAENSTDSSSEFIDLILSGEAIIERRLVLQVSCEALPGEEWPFALNEVALLKGAASMIDIDVRTNGHYLATYRADGLLVSTPTGSTAYNLSAGGPIISPTLDCIVLSPIAPHTLSLRPVVVSALDNIEATVTSRSPEFRLSIDGRSVSIPKGIPVSIKKAAHQVLTVRKPGENFASTLRSKLSWGL